MNLQRLLDFREAIAALLVLYALGVLTGVLLS